MGSVETIVYLDREFISGLYEAKSGLSPATTITRTEGKEAGASLPLFSAGLSSTESRSYSLSTIGMLKEIDQELRGYPIFEEASYQYGSPSLCCWVEGILTIHTIKITNRKHITSGSAIEVEEKVVSDEVYFAIDAKQHKFALVPTDSYFSSGVRSFRDLADKVIAKLELPVRALLRVFSASTDFDQWIAVPLLIVEQGLLTNVHGLLPQAVGEVRRCSQE